MGRRPDGGAAPARAGRRDGPSHDVTIDDVLRPEDSSRRQLTRLPALIWQALVLVRRAAPRELAVAATLQLLAGLSLAAQLFVVRRLLERVTVTDGVPTVASALPELTAFALLSLVVALAALAQKEQQRTLGELVAQYAKDRVIGVTTTCELIDFDRPDYHDRLQRARVNASVRPLQIANGIIGLVSAGAAVVAVGGLLLWLEPLIAALTVLGALPAIYTNRLAARALHQHTVRQTQNERRRDYLYAVLSRKEEAQEVRLFQSASYLWDEHRRLHREKIDDLRATVRRRMWLGAVGAVIAVVVTVASVALLLAFVGTGRLALSDAVVAVGAVVLVAGRLRGVIGSGGTLYEGALFLEDFTDFVDAGSSGPTSDVSEPAASFEELELDDVSFTYPSRSEPSVGGVSLRLRRGEVIALVGENGSGKTTLTKLIAGLYAPTSGTMRWNGVPADGTVRARLRATTTVIFQDFARYFLSVRENVGISRTGRIGDPDAIRRAAAQAGIDGTISAMPNGYDTLLGPAFVGGTDLSAGQWQRLALARAYLRDAGLLILDEPTSSIDPRGEYEIFQQVRQLAEGRTVVLVSHRFPSVRVADRIVVLQHGSIAEVGTHEELMARGGLYAELFDLQASGYVDGLHRGS